ncbi:MAG: hypothetical protein JNJ54_17885 [Myxococcaceae bacterium]|nr:hypothetical protein [Myxococcaceae bacterium]
MRWLLLALLLPVTTLAEDKKPGPCTCGQPNCEAACTCSAGTCPLHRPRSPQPPPPAPPPPAPAPKR